MIPLLFIRINFIKVSKAERLASIVTCSDSTTGYDIAHFIYGLSSFAPHGSLNRYASIVGDGHVPLVQWLASLLGYNLLDFMHLSNDSNYIN